MEQIMPNWLKQRADLTPDRLAIKTESEELTFLDLYKRVQIRVSQLTSLGVKKSNHVAILMKNGTDVVETVHAILSIGAVAVMLNTRLTSEELLWQIHDVHAGFVICNEDLVDKVRGASERAFTIVVSENLSQLEPNNQLNHADSTVHTDQVATIMYTSGTTGKPKGVMQTYGNHWSSAISSALNIGLQHNDRWLLAVPVFHISGLSILFRSVIYGIGVILQERFDPVKVNHSIQHDRVTIISVVSTMLQQMLSDLNEKKYPPTLRCVLTGGGPVPKGLLEDCQHRSIPVYQTYGMTETSSQVVTLPPENSMKKIGSAGKPLFSSQIKIVKGGEACKANEEGEILVKGPTVTKGYWNNEKASKETIKEGWLSTGDQGYLDEEGFLYVLDRRSDLIISGGENVYPAEIESVLLSHPMVNDAGVIGIEEPKWGQVPYAFIVAKEGLDRTELLEFCQRHLASYKIPKGIILTDELPRNASNKLLRRILKEQFEAFNND